MRLEFQFTKSGRKFRLWQLLLPVAILGIVCGLLPNRIGAPIVFGVVGLCVMTIIILVVLLAFRKLRGK